MKLQGRARQGVTEETLITVGAAAKMFTIEGEEGSSSSAQRTTSSFEGVVCGRCSSLERIRILCDVAKGRAGDVQSPSPVTFERNGAGVTTRLLLFHVDHHMATGPLIVLDDSNIFFSLNWVIFKQFWWNKLQPL